MNKTILVVDDVKDIRETIKTVLEIEKLKIITANDGEDCLNKLKTTKPDLILLDVVMPGMKTMEILAEFRKMKLKIPVILMSGSSSAEMRKKADLPKDIAYPVTDFIEKPFENEDLVKRVKNALK